MASIRARIHAALEEIRPFIQADNGDVELVDFQNGVVTVRLMGECVGCPSSTVTLKAGIEKRLKDNVPEVIEVVHAPAEKPAVVKAAPVVQPSVPISVALPVQTPPTESLSAQTAVAPKQEERVTDVLRQIHRRAETILEEMDRALASISLGDRREEHLQTLNRVVRFFTHDLCIHMRMEDEVLFPALIPFISWGKPMSQMASEHDTLEREIQAFSKAVSQFQQSGEHASELMRTGRSIAQHLRDDFYQEENVLFVQADQAITGERAAALREAMQRIGRAANR